MKYLVKIFLCILFFSTNIKLTLFSREHKNSKDNSNTNEIKKLIEILYKKYINSNDSGISTIHMLQIIENKIKNLFNLIENIDPTLIIQAEKVFQKNIFFY